MRCVNHAVRRLRRHPLLSAGLFFATALAILSKLYADRQIVLNTSASISPGLYVRSAAVPAVGRLVDFRIPLAARGYVEGRTGYDGRNWYIIKPIVAGPGDLVDTTGEWLVINGREVARMPPAADAAGIPLPVWRSTRTLEADEFFVFSGRIPNSFDSRCYGPIRRGQIDAVRVRLVTW